MAEQVVEVEELSTAVIIDGPETDTVVSGVFVEGFLYEHEGTTYVCDRDDKGAFFLYVDGDKVSERILAKLPTVYI